jgi:hypothetical protein
LTILNGIGYPSNTLGVDGDFYLDTTHNILYGPKKSSGYLGFGILTDSLTGIYNSYPDLWDAGLNGLFQGTSLPGGELAVAGTIFYTTSQIYGVGFPGSGTDTGNSALQTAYGGVVPPNVSFMAFGDDGTPNHFATGVQTYVWGPGVSIVGPAGPAGPPGPVSPSGMQFIGAASGPTYNIGLLAANCIYGTKFYAYSNITVHTMAQEGASNFGATGHLKMAIYADASNGDGPTGAPLAQTVVFTGSTKVGQIYVAALTAPLTLVAGNMYWLCILGDAAVPVYYLSPTSDSSRSFQLSNSYVSGWPTFNGTTQAAWSGGTIKAY